MRYCEVGFAYKIRHIFSEKFPTKTSHRIFSTVYKPLSKYKSG
jgi:hypothetical protein